jgi:hypothetical protein
MFPGVDTGFQVRGGTLEKIVPSGEKRENFGVFRVKKITFLRQKIKFFPILGKARAGCAFPWIRPWFLYHHSV